VNNLLNIELCRVMYLRLFVVENNKLRAACGKSKIRETLSKKYYLPLGRTGVCLDTISHFSTVVEVVSKMVINQSPVIVYSHEK
jgi:hypothetical protein